MDPSSKTREAMCLRDLSLNAFFKAPCTLHLFCIICPWTLITCNMLNPHSLKSPSQKYKSHTRSLFKLSRRIKSIMDLCSNNVPLLVCTFFYSLTLLCSFSTHFWSCRILFECIKSERIKCGWRLGDTQIKYTLAFTTKNSFCRTRKKARNAKKMGSEEWGLLVFVCLMAIDSFFTSIYNSCNLYDIYCVLIWVCS